MSISRLNFEEVSVADILGLLDAGVPEGLSVEYKSQMYGNSDADVKEALKDISSFANTAGGHLILGIVETGGIPTGIVGLAGIDADRDIQRLENLIRDGIEPRIVGVRFRSVTLESGTVVIIGRIPQSWNPPHRVSARGTNRFYVRNSTGAHEADVEELRRLFSGSSDIRERIRRYRQERVSTVTANHGWVSIMGGGQLILHVLPLAAFGSGLQIDPADAYVLTEDFAPIASEGFSPRFNFDGFINVRGGRDCYGYTQVFRNGVIEATKSAMKGEWQGSYYLPAQSLGDQIFHVLPKYLQGLRKLGVPSPLVVMLTLSGINGAYLRVGNSMWQNDQGGPFRRDELVLPEIVIHDYGTPEEYQAALRPAFDALWNAAGFARSSFFTEDGRWNPRPS